MVFSISPHPPRTGSDHRLDQTEVRHHRTKVAVVVQQRQPMLDAPCSDQKVHGLADGNAATPERSKIARGSDGDRRACHWLNLEAAEKAFNLLCRLFIVEPLQHFAKHQVANDDFVLTENLPQYLNVSDASASEKIDPDAAVDNDQSAPRPLRL